MTALEKRRLLDRAVFGLLISISMISTTAGQAQVSAFEKKTAPIYGGVGASPQPANRFLGMSGTFAPPHKTSDGRACISVNPLTHPQTLNPKIIDHIVIMNNICGESIKLRVCYAGSNDCIIVPLNGYQRLQRTLGIGTGSTSFRYEYSELY